MIDNPKGKYVSIDPYNMDSVAICDLSGMVCNYEDLVNQMEWRGNRLVWTGFRVNKVFADNPNPHLINPLLPPDPKPVINPRFPQFSEVLPIDERIRQLENCNFQVQG